MMRSICIAFIATLTLGAAADDWPKPYSPPCVERENVFEFAEKPAVKLVAKDRYEITFAVKGFCDATVGIVDAEGKVVRHLASGVLGNNAPEPFQKNSLKQKIYWNGKDDLGTYVKEPEKLRVRVMLGLKPEFDKCLGDTNPKNLPGYVFGIAAAPDGVYVLSRGAGSKGHGVVRKFDHDGNYAAAICPPPADIPVEKLKGLCYVEYEPGKRALHGPNLHDSVNRDGRYEPPDTISSGYSVDVRPVVTGGRLYFANPGKRRWIKESLLHYINTDGSTDLEGIRGRPLAVIGKTGFNHWQTRLAASPDGRVVYATHFDLFTGGVATGSIVVKCPLTGDDAPSVFAGDIKGPGSDDTHLNNPVWLDTDAAGRVYVADQRNNRVQVYAPDGKLLKSIPADKPQMVFVHKKNGAIYIVHAARVRGRSVCRLTKLASLDDPKEVFHYDSSIEARAGARTFAVLGALAELDSWSPKPRLWVAGTHQFWSTAGPQAGGRGIRILEDDGTGFRLLEDFDETVRKQAGPSCFGRWSACGSQAERVTCDPVRERVWYGTGRDRLSFDLKTGAFLGEIRLPGHIDDVAFDKRGYVHCHFNPGFYKAGVGRMDPGRAKAATPPGWEKPFWPRPRFTLEEVPYDYGVEKDYGHDWLGVINVMDQPGAMFFQNGIGVNMRGEIAEECNIWYLPKTGDEGFASVISQVKARNESGTLSAGLRGDATAAMVREIQEKRKRGEEIYFIRPRPGIIRYGGTIWTYDSTGELREKCAVTTGGNLVGPQMDEDGNIYFTYYAMRMFGEKTFLEGCAGIIGVPADKTPPSSRSPFSGTFMKGGRKKVAVLGKTADTPLDPLPNRPPDVAKVSGSQGQPNVYGKDRWCWTDGVQWMYATSPIAEGGCICQTQRTHLDWYKRSYVPESYRHSFAILDTNGNFILRFGRYANYDGWDGPKSRKPLGGDHIPVMTGRFVSGTDNYICYDVRGERLIVLRIAYHARETVPIGTKGD